MHRDVTQPVPRRALLLLPAGACLLAGLVGALVLVGVGIPRESFLTGLGEAHGPLMVLGFLGTLIALERAVAARVSWAYAAPLLTSVGAVVSVPPVTRTLGASLTTTGLVVLVAVYARLWRRQHDDLVPVQLAAAGCAVLASVLWHRTDVATTLPWLVGFVVLTVAAERVELARLAIRNGPAVLLGLTTAYLLAGSTALVWPGPGGRAVALVLLVLTVWLAGADVARRTVRLPGQPRFAAVALLAAYAWLGVAALTWFAAGRLVTDAAYDTVVHAVFLGFAMSMVLAHAPVILPAVVRRPLPHRRVFWLPLGVLHVSLGLRVLLGHGVPDTGLWRAGAIGTVLALLLLPTVLLATVHLATVHLGTALLGTALAPGTRRGRGPRPAEPAGRARSERTPS